MIEIFNNAVSPELFAKIRDQYTKVPYKFGWDSNKDQPAGKLFHYAPYVEQNYYHRTDVTKYLSEHPLLLQAWSELRDKGVFSNNARLLRCYFNLQVYGQESALHRDSWEWHEHDSTAVIYLVPDDWDETWGGGTIVNTRDVSFTGCLPKADRAVVFPAALPHRAEPLSKRCLQSRTVLVFKVNNDGSFGPNFEDVGQHYDDFAASLEWNLHRVAGIQLSEHMLGTRYVFDRIYKEASPTERIAAKYYLAYGLKNVPMPKVPTREELTAQVGSAVEEIVHQLGQWTRDEALNAGLPYSKIIEASEALVPQKGVEQ